MGALSRLQKQVREVLSPYDLMIVLGADPLRMSVHSEVDPLPEGMPIVQIGLVDWDLAKNYGAEIALKADVKETLRVLIPALKAAGGAALRGARQTGHRGAGIEELDARGAPRWSSRYRRHRDRSPIDPDWLALQVVEAMPDNAILVDEGLTSSRQITALRPHRDRYGYHALASGGIGWGLPASVGVSLANPDRPVVCLLRRRQRDVFDPGAVDRGASQAAVDGGDRQQWRLSHHQAAAAGVPRRRSLSSAWISSIRRWISPALRSRSGSRRSGSPPPAI